jgi:hypothetical protein
MAFSKRNANANAYTQHRRRANSNIQSGVSQTGGNNANGQLEVAQTDDGSLDAVRRRSFTLSDLLAFLQGGSSGDAANVQAEEVVEPEVETHDMIDVAPVVSEADCNTNNVAFDSIAPGLEDNTVSVDELAEAHEDALIEGKVNLFEYNL